MPLRLYLYVKCEQWKVPALLDCIFWNAAQPIKLWAGRIFVYCIIDTVVNGNSIKSFIWTLNMNMCLSICNSCTWLPVVKYKPNITEIKKNLHTFAPFNCICRWQRQHDRWLYNGQSTYNHLLKKIRDAINMVIPSILWMWVTQGLCEWMGSLRFESPSEHFLSPLPVLHSIGCHMPARSL